MYTSRSWPSNTAPTTTQRLIPRPQSWAAALHYDSTSVYDVVRRKICLSLSACFVLNYWASFSQFVIFASSQVFTSSYSFNISIQFNSIQFSVLKAERPRWSLTLTSSTDCVPRCRLNTYHCYHLYGEIKILIWPSGVFDRRSDGLELTAWRARRSGVLF